MLVAPHRRRIPGMAGGHLAHAVAHNAAHRFTANQSTAKSTTVRRRISRLHAPPT